MTIKPKLNKQCARADGEEQAKNHCDQPRGNKRAVHVKIRIATDARHGAHANTHESSRCAQRILVEHVWKSSHQVVEGESVAATSATVRPESVTSFAQ